MFSAGDSICFKTIAFLSAAGTGEFSGVRFMGYIEKFPDSRDEYRLASASGCSESQKKIPEFRFELRVTVRADICGTAVIIPFQKSLNDKADNISNG